MGDPTLTVRDPITALLRRDRWVVLGGLAALTLFTAVESRSVGDAMMRTPSPLLCVSLLARWGPAELATIALMWSVMMVAMITSTASTMVLAFDWLKRRRIGGTGAPGGGTTSTFLSGYLLVWMGFSLLATLAQWGLHSAAMLSAGGMKMASSSVAAVLLVSAGVFQFSSAKSA